MINWRKPAIQAALWMTGNNALNNLRDIKRLSQSSPEEVRSYQRSKLADILEHAYQTVPYYAKMLEDSEAIVDGEAHPENITEVPILTKSNLREKNERLRSAEPGSEPYTNTSGGTTGEPVEFVQDQDYWEWNVATKLFYQEIAGKPLGGREVKLWGSEDDIQKGRESLKTRAKNYLYNRKLLNSFKMGQKDMREYVDTINSFQPDTIWAYVESIYQLAQFIDEREIDVYPPDGIVTTAGTLHEPVRETIQDVFNTTVYNQYGSREVGDMACECTEQEGLHLFPYSHYFEIVDEDGTPVAPGEEGFVVVTSLTNYSMPLIRYKIGDMAVQKGESCSCDLPFPLIETVTGRVSDHFVTADGKLVHGEYFTHLFYEALWVEQFQVRQVAVDKIVITVVAADEFHSPDWEPIIEGIKSVMGSGVTVETRLQDRIEPSSSGKYRFVISDVH